MNDISRGSIQVQGFKDKEMDFQLIRQLGSSNYMGASIGECLKIANEINDGTPEDWVNAFEKLANWQKKDGLERFNKGHFISAREQLWKACNSFRAAEYYSPCSAEHHRNLGISSAECFAKAMATTTFHFETHALPYRNVEIPVYFVAPKNDGQKRKTLLIVSGFDGTLEEEFLTRGIAGLQRNFNVIHFAGPGQMDVFRKYPHTFFEPDYEEVVRTVINFFENRKEIDFSSLALVGLSFGGYFATRAASYEPRIKALIANSPVINLHAYMTSFVGMDPAEMPDEEDFTLEQLPFFPDSEFPPQLKAQTEQLMIRFGQSSFKKTFAYLKEFQVGEALSNIQCPTLALIGGSEGGEPRKQYDAFCKKLQSDAYEFSDFQGAGSHCQVGNSSFANAVMYDWLESIF
ncbi:dipeptidyl aminopeptidase/acylaminoacyl peptidase (plasmid) [Legionella adelaidensis]|uniref:Dipeptidyl aminopeptidase/acylaminoacyl peptidase n=2 Tax=Legionella adelaidensis TaxID=45056 RepID=A0A0W0R3Z7_9GAMM|nr:alpha/beta hydrolase [Legionella adelaidensis]KTC65756.1 dipeptidyl aminopeptidase/acylaminoacyl peptidase [Legionella adelaidensis]VEH85302.1 dipeptidyl aminopeptidase/acylaminoacyl peptidase [Legionella adelaidensis]